MLNFNLDFKCYTATWKETANFLGFYASTSKYVLFNIDAINYGGYVFCRKDSEASILENPSEDAVSLLRAGLGGTLLFIV
jgi:hypothetical protein